MADNAECNICGGRKFGIKGSRPIARCVKCDSLERTRLLWMYLERMDIQHDTKILHLAPDRCIFEALSKKVAPDAITTADFNPKLYKSFAPDTVDIDLCDLNHWPSEQYDLIMHCHVLEHTPCNIAYTLFHLNRMLTARGRQMFIIPFMAGKWEESFRDLNDDERTRRYSQFDHVRSFGRDDADTHLGKLIPLNSKFDAIADFGEEALTRANIPLAMTQGLTTATVIDIGKDDLFA
ncbi:MAG: hypothetical protein WD969_07155 [Paracoccaceae bacterium]